MIRRPPRLAARIALAVLLAAPAAGARAQEPSASRVVEGRVVRPGAEELLPVPGIWVVLHRVGPDRQGPLDSVRTGRSGEYRFRYAASGSEDAVYFVSAFHAGIAYFSSALGRERVEGEDAEIVVYDTTSRPVPITIRGHHIVVAAPKDGVREVIEVYELSNDSSVTRVAASPRDPVWSALLPSGARRPALREGDVGADAVTFDEGRARVFAPIAPGLRQLAYSYEVPARSLPLSLPVEHHSEMLEVLVESPTAVVSGAGLVRTDPVSVEGRAFSRFLADEAPDNAVVRIDVTEAAGSRRLVWVRATIVVVLAAMLLALARVAARLRGRGEPGARAGADDPERLAREIAALDATFERRRAPSEAATFEYRARRAALKARLADALDRQAEAR